MLTLLSRLKTEQQARSNWSLAFCAGLLGIGQNGLLVSLPVLVTVTHLSLASWAALLTLGSMLFLPSSPWWGKQIEKRGAKPVVMAALLGYILSFVVLGAGIALLAALPHARASGLALLIAARIIYGVTVSGMVPACQVWSLQRAGLEGRMAALATISTGLSLGRLLGPLAAAGLLALNPFAPIWLMALAPLGALLVILPQHAAPASAEQSTVTARFSLRLLPFLGCALLLAASVSLMQLGLAPRLHAISQLSTTAISHHVALLLSVAAASTLLAQLLVVRPQKLSPLRLLLVAALVMSGGMIVMCQPSLLLFYAGCAIASFGTAMATPAYQLLLTDRLSSGKGAGLIAAGHTLGYGISALLVPLVARYAGEDSLIASALMLSLAFLLTTLFIQLRGPATS